MTWVQQNLWTLLAIALYLAICVRVAMHAARYGLPPAKWFLLAMLTAGIAPAVKFLLLARRRIAPPTSAESNAAAPSAKAPPLRRCRQCGASFREEEIDRTSGAAACPRCHLSLENEAPRA